MRSERPVKSGDRATHTRKAKVKKTEETNAGEGVERLGLPPTAGGSVIGRASLTNGMA